MIFRLAAVLCLGYYFACGIRHGFRTSLLWGWPVAAGYFLVLSYLPRPWGKIGLAPFILYLVFLALFLRKSPGPDASAPGDAILILGGRTDGSMPPAFPEERARRGAALYAVKPVPVIVSGGRVKRETETEAETLRRLLLSLGVPAEAILPEPCAADTAENFTRSAPLFSGARRLTVVTHAFHRRRALALAQKALPGVAISFAEAAGQTGLLNLHLWLRESFAYLSDIRHGRAAL